MKKLVLTAIAATILLSGCSTIGLQSKRVFQKEVREGVHKEVTEDIKQASEYLSKSPDVKNGAKVVAVDLSSRVGLPERPLSDPANVTSELRKGEAEYQKDLAGLNRWLDKYQGTELEGTGLSLWGTGGIVIILVVIGLCILVPALIPLVINLIQIAAGTSRAVLKQTSTAMVHAINDFKRENPDAAEELKGYLSKRMDGNSKAIVKKIEGGSV